MAEMNFNWYVVAWIDLLGQTSELEKIPPIPAATSEYETFAKKLQPSFGRVITFRKKVLSLCKELNTRADAPKELWRDLTEEQKVIFERYLKAQVGVEFIGDSALLHICLKEDSSHEPVYSVLQLFILLSHLMLRYLGCRIPLRGGIDVGVCAELSGGGLYGQAISRANYLENKLAKEPRILIGNCLIQYLRFAEDRLKEKNLREVERDLLKKCLLKIEEFLERDARDNRHILSYLKAYNIARLRAGTSSADHGVYVKKASLFIEGEIKQYRNEIIQALPFIENDIERYKRSLNLYKRYMLLKGYFSKHQCW